MQVMQLIIALLALIALIALNALQDLVTLQGPSSPEVSFHGGEGFPLVEQF